MKRLFVLRHAKSSWNNPDLSDFERPLNKRGKKAAPLMGRLMAEQDFVPDLVLSSPAKRTKQTTSRLCESGKLDAPVTFDQRMYGAARNALVKVLSEIDESYAAPLIVGHNSGLENLVHFLTGKYERMPTAALAVIDLDIVLWSDISRDCGQLVAVLRPKEVSAQD